MASRPATASRPRWTWSSACEVRKKMSLTGPRLENADYIISVGAQPEFASSLNRALQMATTDMVAWLTQRIQAGTLGRAPADRDAREVRRGHGSRVDGAEGTEEILESVGKSEPARLTFSFSTTPRQWLRRRSRSRRRELHGPADARHAPIGRPGNIPG